MTLKLAHINPRAPRSSDGAGEPPMEARIARLESHVEHIQSDLTGLKTDVRELRRADETNFRILFGALITAALGLAALMSKGFGWL